MRNKEIYKRLVAAADTEMKNWRSADKLTPLEQHLMFDPVLAGIARAALFLLPTEDYQRFLKEIRESGGVI